MKKQVLIILAILLILILIVGGMFFMRSNKTSTFLVEKGRVIFEYNDTRISEMLSDKDLNTIKELFDRKKLYKDNPSCGFSENIAVVFDETQVFCVACDECPIIYYKNEGQYFRLTTQDYALLHNILKSYGFHFPCV